MRTQSHAKKSVVYSVTSSESKFLQSHTSPLLLHHVSLQGTSTVQPGDTALCGPELKRMQFSRNGRTM